MPTEPDPATHTRCPVRERLGWLVLCALIGSGCARERGYYIALPPADRAWLSPELPARIPPMVDPKAAPYSARQANGKIPAWAGEAAAPYAATVQWAASYYQLPPELIWSVIKVESNFRSGAVSPVGARGLMQLMPGTARDLGVQNPLDPQDNIFGGARYLRILANRFQGDLQFTLAGYNAGPYAVQRHGGIPPYPETLEYVKKVLGFYFASAPPARTATRQP